MPEIAGKSMSTNDAAVLGAGGLFLLLSFFPFYGFSSGSFAGKSISANVTAWHFGVMVLAILLMAAAVAVVAVRLFSSLPTMPVGPRLLALGGAALAAVITLIRVLTLDRQSTLGVSVGPRFGAWGMLALGVVAAVFAFLAFRESGEALPSASGSSTSPPAEL